MKEGLRAVRLLTVTAAAGVLIGLFGGLPGQAPGPITLTLREQHSGTDALLQAVSPVDERIVWMGGHRGSWLRSLDGGESWLSGTVDGAETLEFRDVHAVDASTAWLLSAGSGDASRIYRTDDGGASWRLQYRNTDERAFFDCMAFWDRDTGVVFSDSVDGRLVILRTEDGGTDWRPLPDDALPAALPGEGSFAASGTCVIAAADGRGWIGTGAAHTARVLRTEDRGRTWSASGTPVIAGAAAGIASLVLRPPATLLALGGDIAAPDRRTDGVASSPDGGRTWRLAASPTFPGAVYGAAWIPGTDALVAVGPGGIDLSEDLAASWRHLQDRVHWAVAFASGERGWSVGPGGAITLLTRDRHAPASPRGRSRLSWRLAKRLSSLPPGSRR